MTPTAGETPSREQRLQAILVGYLEAAEKGRAPALEDLLGHHPEFVTELRDFVANLAQFDSLTAPLRAVAEAAKAEVESRRTLTSAGTGTDAAPRKVRYFGDYELLEEIARGGMGVVFKARQVSLNRIVALKMILKGELATETDVQRFRHEAEAAANLDHANIVPIYEVGEHEGQQYFSMKFIEGGSLARNIRDLIGDPRLAIPFLTTVARAVHHAHQRGILHRDLKPGNILLDFQGQPHVTDFGLAKRVEGGSDLTRSGAIVGTPSYMPPEQAVGKKGLSTAADVYALGAILYEMLTGRPPFRGETPMETLMQVVEREPEWPRVLDPRVDRDLETICLKCLEKERDKRYGSAEALAEDLERWLRGEPIRARPISRWERIGKWARRHPARAGLVVVTFMSVVGFLLGNWWYIARLEEANRRALENERRAEWRLYAAHISRAQREWETNHGALARHYLDSCRSDFRGWEHDYLYTLFNRGRRILQTPMMVDCVAVSPDGTRFVSGLGGPIRPQDHRVWALVWDTASGQTILELDGHRDRVRSVALSRDGKKIVTGSDDQTVKIWDADSGRNLLTVPDQQDAVLGVDFSPDAARIVVVARDQPAKVWDAANGKEIHSFRGNQVVCVSYSPDGKKIATGAHSGAVQLWDAHEGKPIWLGMHKERVTTVAFTSEGARVVSGSWDKTITVWDAHTGKELRTLRGHDGPVESTAISRDGKNVVSCSDNDGTIRLWDAEGGKESKIFKDHARSVVFTPDGKIISRSWDRTVKLWNVADTQENPLVLTHSFSVSKVALSPDNKWLVSGSNRTLTIWHTASGKKLRTMDGHKDHVHSVSFSPDGTRIVSGGSDHAVMIWDAATGEHIRTLRGHTFGATLAAYSPDGTRIVSGAGDQTVKVWDAAAGQELFSLSGHTGAITSLTFSPDGKWIVSGDNRGTLKAWNSASGKQVWTRDAYELPFDVVLAVSADSTKVVSGGWREFEELKVWQLSDGRSLGTVQGQRGIVTALAFSPDGRRIVSGSSDHTLKIWDAASGEETMTLEGHANEVTSVVFSPDGTKIFSGSNDATVRVWDASRKP